MKASLLAALVALAFPACERQSPGIELPASSSSTLAPSAKLPCYGGVVLNIDQHEGRVILDRHYDSDSALKGELIRRTAVNPPVTVVVRADRQVRYDVIARTLLLIREVGISEVYLAFRRPDSPIAEEYLRLR